MRFLCVHCDHRWEAEGDGAPRRCPSCMRATGIEAIREPSAGGAETSRNRWWRVLAAAAAVIIAGFILLRVRDAGDRSDAARLAPLDDDALASVLQKEQVTAGALERVLASDASIERFAERAAADASGSFARAEAVTRAVRERAKKLAFVAWSLGEPRPSPVMIAKDTLAVVDKDGGRAELYPLEVAALAVSALRALDVPAMIAELAERPGERAPLDASGYLGYFVVAAYEREAGKGAARLYDPYGGQKLTGSEKHTVLRDPEVVGAALALSALHAMSYRMDPKGALDASSQALRLAATLPSVRTVHALVLLDSKMIEQGIAELEAARQLRPDAPRLHNLASARLMSGDVASAEKDLTAALAKAPDFAGVRATLAALSLMRGDEARAREELLSAERLAPDSSLVQWGLAEYFLRAGSRDEGLSRAQRAFEARPSLDAHLRYGLALRQAARYEELRRVAHGLVDGAPEYRKGELRELVRQVFGVTALDPVEADDSGKKLENSGNSGLKLELGQGSKLLGEPVPEPSGKAAPGDPLILLGDPSKLRLREPGQSDLKLDLGAR